MNKIFKIIGFLMAAGLGAALALGIGRMPGELAPPSNPGAGRPFAPGMAEYPGGSTAAFERQAASMTRSLEPSPEEKQAIDEALSQKIRARESLSQESFALFQLAMDPATSDEQITEAIDRFLDAKRDLQQRVHEIDAELVASVSPRTRAKLLTSGVLDNGLGFMGGRGLSLRGSRPSPPSR